MKTSLKTIPARWHRKYKVISMHFGASKHQITLHTGVHYVGRQGKANPFCTVSDSMNHSPPAIWAHLKPVLDFIQSEHKIGIMHFASDGPTSQYRQRPTLYCSWRRCMIEEWKVHHGTSLRAVMAKGHQMALVEQSKYVFQEVICTLICTQFSLL